MPVFLTGRLLNEQHQPVNDCSLGLDREGAGTEWRGVRPSFREVFPVSPAAPRVRLIFQCPGYEDAEYVIGRLSTGDWTIDDVTVSSKSTIDLGDIIVQALPEPLRRSP